MQAQLTVYKAARWSQRTFFLKANLYEPKEEAIIKITDNKIIFTRPALDYTGKTYTVSKLKDAFTFTVATAEVPVGTYYPNEDESDRDKLVFNFN